MFSGEFQLIFPVVQYKIALHADDTCICSSKNKPLSSLGLFYCFIAFNFTVTNNGHYFTDIVSLIQEYLSGMCKILPQPFPKLLCPCILLESVITSFHFSVSSPLLVSSDSKFCQSAECELYHSGFHLHFPVY